VLGIEGKARNLGRDTFDAKEDQPEEDLAETV